MLPHELKALCASGKLPSLNTFMAAWRGREPEAFQKDPSLYACMAETSLKLGEPLLACDIIREGLAISDRLELKHLHLKALTQSGAYQSAINLLNELSEAGSDDPDLLHLKGKLHKYLGFSSSNRTKVDLYLGQALLYYRKAYDYALKQNLADKKSHAAINLATLSILRGDSRAALKQVNEIIRDVEGHDESKMPAEFWRYAVLAESYTILGDLSKASQMYEKAAASARANIQSIISMRRQAQFLLRHLGRDEHLLDSVFQIPSVASMMGLLVDQEGRDDPRFPAGMVAKVRRQIGGLIVKSNIEIGFSSGGAGGDLIFADEMIRRNHEMNIVLPVKAEIYRRNIQELSGGEWVELFDQVIARASSVTVLSDEMGTDDQAPYRYCAEVVDGMAALRAKALAANHVSMMVWDEKDLADIRATAEIVRKMKASGREFITISTAKSAKKGGEDSRGEASQDLISIRDRQEVRAILFADTVGFSKLSDRNVPFYVEHFLGAIPKVIERTGNKHLYLNTWGDALFMVFPDLVSASSFALNLCDELQSISWRKKGLPEGLNFRVALHAGPVYELKDPLTGIMNYYGYHVSQSARIEPITPPGEVYTSEGFAALLAISGSKEFVCDYVGRVPYAKGFGTFPIYHLRRLLF